MSSGAYNALMEVGGRLALGGWYTAVGDKGRARGRLGVGWVGE